MRNKKIKFRYFGVVKQKKEGNRWNGQGKWNVESWMDIVDRSNLEKKSIDIGNGKARIEQIELCEYGNVWFFRLMKLREDNIPSIAKEECAATNIDLKDDESIGEDVYMLYDNDTGIAMIQSTNMSLGIGKLEKLLTTVWNAENERFKIIAILEREYLENIGRKRCKKIEVGFANIVNDCSEGCSSLGRLLNIYREMHGVNGKIEISLGRSKRGGTLNIDNIRELLKDAVNEPCVTKAKMKVVEDDDTDREIDLFDSICYDWIEVMLEDKKPLLFDVITGKMLACYMTKKEYLDSLIHPAKY